MLTMNLYELLGVSREATADELKKSYRERSKVLHPDKGGDPEEFKKLSEAYAILSDVEKRARYDAGESADSISKVKVSFEDQVMRGLVELFTQIVAKVDTRFINIVEEMRANLRHNIGQLEVNIKNVEARRERLESAVKRIKNPNGDNVFIASALAQIENTRLEIQEYENRKKKTEAGLKFLENYSYDTDQMTSNPQFFTWTTTV